MKKQLVTVLCIALGVFAFAQEEAPAKPEGGRPAPGFRQQGFMKPENVGKRFEKMAEEFIKLYDKDQNGVLSPEEKAAMEKEFQDTETQLKELQKKTQLVQRYRRFQVVDADGDMKISEEEKEKAPERLEEFEKKQMAERQARGQFRPGQKRPGEQNGKGAKDRKTRPERKQPKQEELPPPPPPAEE